MVSKGDLTKGQGLLATPFVLHSQPTAVFEPHRETMEQMATIAQRRYAEIMRDIEELINDHSLSSITRRILKLLFDARL